MATANQTRCDRRVHLSERGFGQLSIHGRHQTAVDLVDQTPVRTAQVVTRDAHLVQQVTGLFQIHRRTIGNVRNLAQRADQQRRRNRNRLSVTLVVGIAKLVMQTVFAADERSLQNHRQILASDRGSDQRAQRFGSVGKAPAKVIQHRNPARIGTHGNAVSNRFVDPAGGHVVRIQIAVQRIHAARHRQAPSRLKQRSNHRRIARAIVLDADHRLDHAAALDFVVVLSDDPLLAGHVQAAENLCQVRGPFGG